jgi:hypothetical protein
MTSVVLPRAYLDVFSQGSSFYTNLTSAASPLAGRFCGIHSYEGRMTDTIKINGGLRFFACRFVMPCKIHRQAYNA